MFKKADLLDEDEQTWQEAYTLYKRIIELDPGFYHAHVNAACTAFNLGMLQTALSHIEEALKTEGGKASSTVWFDAGFLRYSEGDVRGALKCFKKANELEPHDDIIKENINLCQKDIERRENHSK
jgi:tetratricopeptide (TPR) repeat protein